MPSAPSRALAHPNIALVKYWGKRDDTLNLPATPSISMTVGPWATETAVTPIGGPNDRIVLDGAPASPAAAARVITFLDLLRARANRPTQRLEIVTHNNFPTAAGFASSASGFAALAVAGMHALGLRLNPQELSALARRGSGSAARSLASGFALMHEGSDPAGTDAFAEPIALPEPWDLRMLAVVCSAAPKAVSSSEAMRRTRDTSPYYAAWCAEARTAVPLALAAINARDFPALGALAETQALRMHAAALAAQPPVCYWNATTVNVLEAIWAARAQGLEVFATIDAGPQVKLLCEPRNEDAATALAAQIPGVLAVHRLRLGAGARLL